MITFLRMLAGIGPMKRYLERQLQAARESGGDGLIAELVRVEKEGGRISKQEMVASRSFCALFLRCSSRSRVL
jgi:cytochrome P450 PksS